MQDLMAIINDNLYKFRHVSEFIPASIIKSLDKFSDKVNNEIEKRELY